MIVAHEPGHMDPIRGLHHVTAYASDPQENYEFVTEVLGLRFCRQTLLYMPGQPIYHLYYGDEAGHPGTVLTYFPQPDMEPGQPGQGQFSTCSFTIPEESVDYWLDRLESFDIPTQVEERFDETAIGFSDPDGLPLELVTGESDIDPWEGGDVPAEHGIRGMHGVALESQVPAETFETLETMGWERVGRHEDTGGARIRYQPGEPADRGRYVDVLVHPNQAPWQVGTGTIVHVAFRVTDEDDQDEWREYLEEHDRIATERKYRQEFRSQYFNDPSGATFEMATDGPGFTAHEDLDSLGEELQIPEPLRDMYGEEVEELKEQLPPFEPN